MKKYIEYYYGNTNEQDHMETDNFIKEHKNQKNF